MNTSLPGEALPFGQRGGPGSRHAILPSGGIGVGGFIVRSFCFLSLLWPSVWFPRISGLLFNVFAVKDHVSAISDFVIFAVLLSSIRCFEVVNVFQERFGTVSRELAPPGQGFLL